MTEENEQRMERLFHDHYEQMYRFAFALLHDNEEARDVVSDVFSRLWDKQLVPDRAYLMRSVKNACINLIARKGRTRTSWRASPSTPMQDTATTEIYTLSLHDALPISIHLLVMVVEQPFHPLFIFFCHHVIFFLFLLLYTSFPEINYP